MRKSVEFKYVGIITLIYLVFAVVTWKYTASSFFIDTGREAYIPLQMVKGATLYKDILNVYGPLGYQINATLFYLFGANLTVLLIAGLLNGYVFTITVYALARALSSKIISLALTIMVMCIFEFYYNAFVFPYSYAMAYATTAVYLSVLFLVLFLAKRTMKYFYIACLFAGTSFILKYDFIIYLLVLIAVLAAAKKIRPKEVVISAFWLLLVPTGSIIILLLSGVAFSDLIQSVTFIKTLTSTESIKLFYSRFSSFLPNLTLIIIDLASFTVINILLGSFFLIVHAIRYYKNLGNTKNSFFQSKHILHAILLSVAPAFIFIYFSNSVYFLRIFSWVPLSTVIILGTYIYANRTRLKETETLINITVIMAAATFSIKGLSYCSIIPYGTFLLPLSTVVFYIFITRIIAKYRPNITKYEQLVAASIIIFSLITFVEMHVRVRVFFSEMLTTNYGSMHISREINYKDLFTYIENNTKPSEKVLVIPEGQMINFLTNRSSDNVLSTIFFPPYMEAYGEDNIMQKLKDSKINTIVIIKRSMSEYLPNKERKESYFGSEYALDAYAYIISNYTKIMTLGNNELITVYKLK